MQFIKGGPDIPERLLQAHEDGRVVFFCGAGISYPAHLPGFSDLVKEIFRSLDVEPSSVQKTAIKAKQFDTAVGLLESDAGVGRELVRGALAKTLTPDLSSPDSMATQAALLTLGKCRDGRTKLVTTNFDRLFEEVIVRDSLSVERFQAPLLPVPKSRWDGLVYLHGLLTEPVKPADLNRLVVSSGDFGLAYLTERWAARFVSELFRNYTVCFVGYSITDPVLRYMMDALAADRLLGESSPEMFAFGSYSKGRKDERASEWCAKHVTPILYREHNKHIYLHKTLRAWAKTYRDGVRGKEHIVIESAMARPLMSTTQDDFVGRMLWALSDPLGLPAKRFAELDPVPSLDWLVPLSEVRYRKEDLRRFGISPAKTADNDLKFSLISRPSPYSLASWMSVVDAGFCRGQWDEVMRQLASWLVRHLDDPNLLLWLVKGGGQLNESLVTCIERRLEHQADIEMKSGKAEIEYIRANAPNEIAGPLMRTLWRLLLTGRVKSWRLDLNLYRWRDRFKRDGLTASLRFDLREMLAPRVSLSEPYHRMGDEESKREAKLIRDLVEWEVVLSADHVHSGLRGLSDDKQWRVALPELLSDFTGLLRDALDLMRELGGAENRRDLSYMHLPSVSPHPQNNDYHDWTVLIELTRDAWLALAEYSPARAALEAEVWGNAQYPVFRRLLFFAAAQDGVISHRRALDWLLADEHWWLWSVETERETIRLLVSLAPKLDEPMLDELVHAIISGPPAVLDNAADSDHWGRVMDRKIQLRLAKISHAGAALSEAGKKILDELSIQYPEFKLAADERDEFPYWTGDGDEWRKFNATPRRRRELTKWLKLHSNEDFWQEDDWRQRCKDNFATTACALYVLACDDVWPTDRWSAALQAWSEERLINISWRHMAPVINNAPSDVMQDLAHSISWWIKAVAKGFNGNENLFLSLSSRVLALDYPEVADVDDAVSHAINHPVGQVTQALLHFWYRTTLEDGQGIPGELRQIFSALCDTRVDKYRHGRVILTAHVVAIFRVDEDWARQYLLPLFDWEYSQAEASSAWEGFLWSPRLYRPLMEQIKNSFLEAAQHYNLLGAHRGQYAAMLTLAALDRSDTFSVAELARATGLLPSDGLHSVARTLVRAFDGAGDQRMDYWANRVIPYISTIWPKNREHASPRIAESIARLCIIAKELFPEALAKLRPWLQFLPHPEVIIRQLSESGLCHKFPQPSLDFLGLVVDTTQRLPASDLGACLEQILNAAPELEGDQFQRLEAYVRLNNRS